MSMSGGSSHKENSYIFDPNSTTEMARLILQDRLINQAMEGLLPEESTEKLEKIHHVLDIGCGPAGWTLDVARLYKHMYITGIDISPTMITYATEQARQHGLTNIEFKIMDALQERLSFPDDQFDLINLRNAVGFIPRDSWRPILQECYRVTRPGGILRLTEGDTMGLTNSPAYERHHRIGTEMMMKLGYGFSPDGLTLGITPVLGKLLREAKYTHIQMQPHIFDFSYGTSFYSGHIQNIIIVFNASQSRLMREQKISQEELEKLYNEVLTQLGHESFRGVNYFLTAWGEKI